MGEFARYETDPQYTGPQAPTTVAPAAPNQDTTPHAGPVAVDVAGKGPMSAPVEAPPAQAPGRPEWLPEKFKSPEDMAKAYGELEKKLGQAPAATQEQPPADPKATPPATPDAAKELLTTDELQKYGQEFMTTGRLSEASYKELVEGKRIPRPLVDAYMDGVRMKGEAVVAQVLQEVGGQEQYDAVRSWMAQSMPAPDLDLYNKAMQSGDPTQILNAARSAKARYDAAMASQYGQPPARSIAGMRGGQDNAPFLSQAQAQAAMRDPRYKVDPAYRAMVAERLKNSTY